MTAQEKGGKEHGYHLYQRTGAVRLSRGGSPGKTGGAQSFDLIERAAQQVCDAVLEGYPQVEELTLVLKKPEAPIPEKFDYVAVEVTQRRKEREA